MIKSQKIHEGTIQSIEERVSNVMFTYNARETDGLKDEIDLYIMESGLTPAQTKRLKQAKNKLNDVEGKNFMESKKIIVKNFFLFFLVKPLWQDLDFLGL